MKLELQDKMSVPCTRNGKEWEVDLTKMDSDTVAALFWHGLKQKLNDAGNKAKEEGKTEEQVKEDAYKIGQETLTEIYENGFDMGGSRSRISDFERECRAIFVVAMTRNGKKRSDAEKLAARWRTLVDDASVQKIENRAKKNLSVDLDLEITV